MQRVHLRGVLQRLDLLRAAGVLRPYPHELADEFVVDLLDPDGLRILTVSDRLCGMASADAVLTRLSQEREM